MLLRGEHLQLFHPLDNTIVKIQSRRQVMQVQGHKDTACNMDRTFIRADNLIMLLSLLNYSQMYQ